MRNVLVAMSGLALLAACNGPAEESGAEEVEAASPPAEMAEGAAGQTGDVTLQASESFQSDLQTALIQASEGATITLPAGTFEMTDGLSLDVNGVTLTGAGEGETILDFLQLLRNIVGPFTPSPQGVSKLLKLGLNRLLRREMVLK